MCAGLAGGSAPKQRSRIAATFGALRGHRAALITFIEAYDPDRATSLALLTGMAAHGADIIEIGVPFTDPMADGPTIQAAARRALLAGATLPGVLGLVTEFRTANDHTPIVLMGYLNPILSYGVETFCQDAAAAGVDGLIVVDLPTEEAGLLLPSAAAHALDVIRLIAPTTSDERLPLVLAGSSGFVYYVSITGITGTPHRHRRRPSPRHPPPPPRHVSPHRGRLRHPHPGAGGAGSATRGRGGGGISAD